MVRVYVPSVYEGSVGQVPTVALDGTLHLETPSGAGAPLNAEYLLGVADVRLPNAIVPTAAGLALIDDANAAAQRVTLGLGTAATTASTDYDPVGSAAGAQAASDPVGSAAAAQAASQPLDAELSAIAGLVSAADRVPYFTGVGAAALATLTTAGRSLIAALDAAAARVVLGLGTAATSNTGDFDAAGAATAAQAAAEATAAAALAAKRLNGLVDPNGSVQFAQQQALQFRIENRTSDPVSPSVGELWLRVDL